MIYESQLSLNQNQTQPECHCYGVGYEALVFGLPSYRDRARLSFYSFQYFSDEICLMQSSL
jgi:hypothetical protein